MISGNVLRAVFVVVAAATVAACSSSGPPTVFKQRSKEFFSEKHYGPASPRVVHAGPVPKGGGRAMVGDPYKVAGKTYVPTFDPSYSEVGLASWYGEAFHGRQTANGEVYDVNGLTAAHPTLPLPSYARVTNLENGRSMIVRVNDRGPFAHDRIIDLSSKVADMLAMKGNGTARVEVDYVGPARMDGMDQKVLMASYQGPAQDDGTRFAWIKPKARQQAPVVMAAMAPMPRVRPTDLAAYPPRPAAIAQDPLVLVPAFLPADEDPLAPLIMRSGLVTSYADAAPLSDAQNAASDLANDRFEKPARPTLQAALVRAASKRAQELGTANDGTSASGAVVQLGSFGDPANAARVAAKFERFGTVQQVAQTNGGRNLTLVRVALADSGVATDVIDAAADAGLTGAFVLAH